MKKSPIAYFTLCVLLSSCVAMKNKYHKDLLHKSLVTSPVLDNHFTGFSLYDPASDESLYQLNADKFFTPASNTKLLSLLAGATSLSDSIPALKYKINGDSLIFTGTGDPTFLHPAFDFQPAMELLSDSSYQLYFVPTALEDTPFAPGWTWEDYQYYYQAERNGMPLYGNTVNFTFDSLNISFDINPPFFEPFAEVVQLGSEGSAPYRDWDNNIFSYPANPAKSNYKNRVPFKTSDELTLRLLEDTLHRSISRIESYDFESATMLKGTPSLTLYRYTMKISDNFCAEQMMYLAATNQNRPLNSASVIYKLKQDEFKDISNDFVWKDGSGLSRYNLVTPDVMIEVMKVLTKKISIENLKTILPNGGADGTLKNWYTPLEEEETYVFAKTGTLSNNHNLTGIIRTKSGRDLFFSFMNNNYLGGSTPVKEEMEKVLRVIYDWY